MAELAYDKLPGDDYGVASFLDRFWLDRPDVVAWVYGIFFVVLGALQATGYYRGSTYVAYVVFGLTLLRFNSSSVGRIPEFWLLVALMAWYYVTIVAVPPRLQELAWRSSWYATKIHVMALMVMLVATSFRRGLLFLKCLLIGAAFVAVVGAVYSMPVVAEGGGRVAGVAANPNSSAGVVLFGGLAAIILLPIVGKVWKTFIWVYFALAVVALLGSGTRGAVICLSAAILAYFTFEHARYVKDHWKTIVPILIVLIAIPYAAVTSFGQNPTVERMTELTHRISRGEPGDDRLVIYSHAWNLFKQHWVLGIGTGTYRYYSGGLSHTHTTFLELLLTKGPVGFLLYYLMVLCLWLRLRKLLKIYRENRYVRGWINGGRAFIVALLLHNLVSLDHENKFAMFILATLVGLTARLSWAVDEYQAGHLAEYEYEGDPEVLPGGAETDQPAHETSGAAPV